MKNGGKRPGAGRKSKAEEIKLIEKLTPMAPKAFEAIKEGLQKKDFQYVKLFMEYYAGKPKERVDVTTNGESITSIKLVDVDGTEI